MHSKSRSPSFPALVLAFAAFTAFLWSVLLDWHFVLGESPLSVSQVGLAGVIYAAILAGWVWALLSAARNSRSALVALAVYAFLLSAYAVMDLLVYCPETCGRVWLYYVANWANLILGLSAAIALVLKLRKS